MNVRICTSRGRHFLMLLLACLALTVPSALQAQEDTYLHFTVNVAKSISCDVIICYYMIDGTGICAVFSPGASIALRGSGPFTIVDAAGTYREISDRVGCIRSLSISPNCCVDVCYSLDGTASPVITVTPAANPTCPDA